MRVVRVMDKIRKMADNTSLAEIREKLNNVIDVVNDMLEVDSMEKVEVAEDHDNEINSALKSV